MLSSRPKQRPVRRQAESALKTEKDRISYSLGMNIGSSLKMNEVDVNTDLVIRGLKDAISNAKPLMTDDEIRAALTAFQTSMQAKQAASKEKELTENKTKGDAFLAANKAKEGVVVLPERIAVQSIENRHRSETRGDGSQSVLITKAP